MGLLVPIEIDNLIKEINEENRLTSGGKDRLSEEEIMEAIQDLEENSKKNGK